MFRLKLVMSVVNDVASLVFLSPVAKSLFNDVILLLCFNTALLCSWRESLKIRTVFYFNISTIHERACRCSAVKVSAEASYLKLVGQEGDVLFCPFSLLPLFLPHDPAFHRKLAIPLQRINLLFKLLVQVCLKQLKL